MEAEVKSLRPKRRKRVIPDRNSRFVTIEQVIAIRAQMDEELEEEGSVETLEEDEEQALVRRSTRQRVSSRRKMERM